MLVLAVVLSDAALGIRHKVNTKYTKQQEHLTSFANFQNMSKNIKDHMAIFQNIFEYVLKIHLLFQEQENTIDIICVSLHYKIS